MGANPCAILRGPLKASVNQTFLPQPSLSDYPSDYVLLRVAYTGVCGSDVHFYLHGGVGSDERKYAQYYTSQSQQDQQQDGLVMGHEASAVVMEVGPATTDLEAGDQVAIEPGIPCRKCARCAEGLYNLCLDMRFAASFFIEDSSNNVGDAGTVKATPGTLSKYYVLPAKLCYKLPPRISLQEGVLVEPLAVGVHAVRLAQIGVMTQNVVVMGSGTIGLMSAAAAMAFGARQVVLVDVDNKKLEFATSWLGGQDETFKKRGTSIQVFQTDVAKSPAENAALLKKQCSLPGIGVDVVLEASGASPATSMGVFALRTNGHMVQTGLSKQPLVNEFPIVELSEKEIHLHGAFRYGTLDFATAVDLIARDLVPPVKKLITNVFKFENFEDAWKATKDGKGIKNLIEGVQD